MERLLVSISEGGSSAVTRNQASEEGEAGEGV
jgi:hypothetical protein